MHFTPCWLCLSRALTRCIRDTILGWMSQRFFQESVFILIPSSLIPSSFKRKICQIVVHISVRDVFVEHTRALLFTVPTAYPRSTRDVCAKEAKEARCALVLSQHRRPASFTLDSASLRWTLAAVYLGDFGRAFTRLFQGSIPQHLLPANSRQQQCQNWP